jgi:hypothetical protein
VGGVPSQAAVGQKESFSIAPHCRHSGTADPKNLRVISYNSPDLDDCSRTDRVLVVSYSPED